MENDAATTQRLRKAGLEVLGYMGWGTHCCHFFQTQQDVLETLLPFFQAGLEANEFCLWVIDEPLTIQTARRALKQGIPAGDRYLRDGSMQLVSARRWYLEGGKF